MGNAYGDEGHSSHLPRSKEIHQPLNQYVCVVDGGRRT